MIYLQLFIGYVVYATLSLFLLWVYYLAVMNLARVHQSTGLNKLSTCLGTIVLVIGYLLDFNANVVVMTVIGIELPSETTVTARLKRWIASNNKWHVKVAKSLEKILDPFDPSGDHV